MKIKIICILLSAVFLIAGIWIAVSYRAGLKTADLSDEALANYKIEYLQSGESYGSLTLISARDIVQNSDAIYLVEATGNRTLSENEILSEVTVKHCFKQYKDIKENETIYIYEPVKVNIYKTNRTVGGTVSGGYIMLSNFNIMEKNKTYIVFLKFFERPEEYYNYSEREQRTFLFTDKNVGLFPCETDVNCLVINIDSTVRFYNEIREYDYITHSKERAASYSKLQKELFEIIDYKYEQ